MNSAAKLCKIPHFPSLETGILFPIPANSWFKTSRPIRDLATNLFLPHIRAHPAHNPLRAFISAICFLYAWGGLATCYMTLWRAKVLLMRHTATLQNRENVQAHTHCFATSGQRLLYVAQHLRTPAVFIPQMAYSSPQSHKKLYLKVQQALANTKPTAHSKQTFPSKHLFIPN